MWNHKGLEHDTEAKHLISPNLQDLAVRGDRRCTMRHENKLLQQRNEQVSTSRAGLGTFAYHILYPRHISLNTFNLSAVIIIISML